MRSWASGETPPAEQAHGDARGGQPDLPSQAFSPMSGVRGILDALVQGSLVDLFQVYGVALAPLPRTVPVQASQVPEIAAAIIFTHGSGYQGRLTISVPISVLELTVSRGALPLQQADWARELANQLLGRIKNRLLQFGLRIQAGLPFSVDPQRTEEPIAAATATRVYAARTLRGQIVVTIEGLPKESELVYVGPAGVASEGEAILF
jgi:hypothetical protein